MSSILECSQIHDALFLFINLMPSNIFSFPSFLGEPSEVFVPGLLKDSRFQNHDNGRLLFIILSSLSKALNQMPILSFGLFFKIYSYNFLIS